MQALELHEADAAHRKATRPGSSSEVSLKSFSEFKTDLLLKAIKSSRKIAHDSHRAQPTTPRGMKRLMRVLLAVNKAITATEKPLSFVIEHATDPSIEKKEVGCTEAEESDSSHGKKDGTSEDNSTTSNPLKTAESGKTEALVSMTTSCEATTTHDEPQMYDWQFFKGQERRMKELLEKGDCKGAISIYESLLLIRDPYTPRVILLRMSWLLSLAQGLPSISFLSEIRRLASIVQVEGCVLDDHYRDTASEILGEPGDYWKRAKPFDTQEYKKSSHESAGGMGPATTKPDPMATTTSCENNTRAFYQRQLHRIETFLRQGKSSSANAIYKGIVLLSDPQEPTYFVNWMNTIIMLYELRDVRTKRADPFRFEEHQRLVTKMETNERNLNTLDAWACWRHLRRVEEELFGVTELIDSHFQRPTNKLEAGDATLCPKVETCGRVEAQSGRTETDPRPIIFGSKCDPDQQPRKFTLVRHVDDEGRGSLHIYWGQSTTTKASQKGPVHASRATTSNSKVLNNGLAPEGGADKEFNFPVVEE